MALANLLQELGEEIQVPEEGKYSRSRRNMLNKRKMLIDTLESFLLFAQADRSSNLGFVDLKKRFLEISVAGKDLVIEQSPSLLNSNRADGTTGAGGSAGP